MPLPLIHIYSPKACLGNILFVASSHCQSCAAERTLLGTLRIELFASLDNVKRAAFVLADLMLCTFFFSAPSRRRRIFG